MRRRRRSSQSTRRTQRAFKQCEAADGEKLVALAVARVACIASSEVWELYRRSTATADISPIFAPVDRSEHFEEAFATIVREHADALVTENMNFVRMTRPVLLPSYACARRCHTRTPERSDNLS